MPSEINALRRFAQPGMGQIALNRSQAVGKHQENLRSRDPPNVVGGVLCNTGVVLHSFRMSWYPFLFLYCDCLFLRKQYFGICLHMHTFIPWPSRSIFLQMENFRKCRWKMSPFFCVQCLVCRCWCYGEQQPRNWKKIPDWSALIHTHTQIKHFSHPAKKKSTKGSIVQMAHQIF